MAMLEHADQRPNQRLVADQQDMLQAQPLDLTDNLLHIAFRSQPGHGAHRLGEAQGVMHQGGRLLGTYVRAGDDRLQRLPQQAGGAVQHLLAAVGGQPALGIAVGPRLRFAVAPAPHPVRDEEPKL